MSSNAFFQSTDPQAFKQSRDPQARRTRGLPDGLVEVRVDVPVAGIGPFPGYGTMYFAVPDDPNVYGEWRTAADWGGDLVCNGDGTGDPHAGLVGQLPRPWIFSSLYQLVTHSDYRSSTRYKKVTLRVETSARIGGQYRPVPWDDVGIPDFETTNARDWKYEFYWDDAYVDTLGYYEAKAAYGISGPPGSNFWSKVHNTDDTTTETGQDFFGLLDKCAMDGNALNIAGWNGFDCEGTIELNLSGTGSKMVYYAEADYEDGENPGTFYHYYTRITVERTYGQAPIFDYTGCETSQIRSRAHAILDTFHLDNLNTEYDQFVIPDVGNPGYYTGTTFKCQWHRRYRIYPVHNPGAHGTTLWAMEEMDLRVVEGVDSEIWVLPGVAPHYELIPLGNYDEYGIRWLFEPPMVTAYRNSGASGGTSYSWIESKVRFKESQKWCCTVWNCDLGEARQSLAASAGINGREPSDRMQWANWTPGMGMMPAPYSYAGCGVNGSHYIDAQDYFSGSQFTSGFMAPLRWATETYYFDGAFYPLDPWPPYINVPPECGGMIQPGYERNKTADDKRPADEGYTP